MDKRRRIVILSLALVALAFTGAYALAGDDGGGDPPATPETKQDAAPAIATPEVDVQVPATPPGGEWPELQVPEPSPTPDDDGGPGPSPTPGPQPSAEPPAPDSQDPDPTVVPTPQPTPEPPVEEGGGED